MLILHRDKCVRMKIYKNSRTREYLLYAVLFVIVLLFPFFRVGGYALDSHDFQWTYVLRSWADVFPFVVLLAIHIFVLMPILLDKKRTGLYVVLTLLLLVLFFGVGEFRHDYIISQRSPLFPPPPPPSHPSLPPPPFHPSLPPPSPGISGPVIIDTIIAILLIGFSVSVRLMFKHHEDTRRVEELERACNRQEIAQLKAQVSPHFFMNSLNNIHGMVEIDPPTAQEMILELSGLMRYVLYECASPLIPLSKEIEFLSDYISLMRVRYSPSKVDIRCDFPDLNEASLVSIAPLMFIVFVENAFKHGVSYSHPSYVDVKLSIESEKIYFYCENSSFERKKCGKAGGVGLVNIRKRLDILYASEYDLKICQDKNKFCVSLTLPIRDEN